MVSLSTKRESTRLLLHRWSWPSLDFFYGKDEDIAPLLFITHYLTIVNQIKQQGQTGDKMKLSSCHLLQPWTPKTKQWLQAKREHKDKLQSRPWKASPNPNTHTNGFSFVDENKADFLQLLGWLEKHLVSQRLAWILDWGPDNVHPCMNAPVERVYCAHNMAVGALEYKRDTNVACHDESPWAENIWIGCRLGYDFNPLQSSTQL